MNKNQVIPNSDYDKEVPENKQELIKITAFKLNQEYEDNEVLADSLYKGKTLEVSGYIKSISKDLYDKAYIELKTSNMFTPVDAYPKSSQENMLLRLKKGQSIILQCIGDGYYMGADLKDCVIK